MSLEEFRLRQAVALGSALLYWGGVAVQARRVRRRIGRSPNVRPRTGKERLLWAGWMLVVGLWIALPFLAQPSGAIWLTSLWPGALQFWSLAAGLLAVVAGYGATLWCYAIMGDTWRMGVDRQEKTALVTSGPYAVVRHPIYLFQVIMLLGVALLLPCPLALLALAVHLVCVWIKAADEEAFLLNSLGEPYRAYLGRTGRVWPRIMKQKGLKG